MNIVINGVTLQGDYMDADFAGPFEEATKRMAEKAANSQKKHYDSVAQGFLEQCETVDAYFNEIFGEGTAAEVFKGKEHHLMAHLEAVEQLTNWAAGERKKLNDFTNRYTQRQKARAQYQKYEQRKGKKK